MPLELPGNPIPYFDDAQELRAIISLQQDALTSIEENLPNVQAVPNPPIFNELAAYFSGIALEYNRLLRSFSKNLYPFINRSQRRKSLMEQIIQSANKASKQFERYQKKPESYSWSETRFIVDRVRIDLENLETSIH